MTRNGKGAGTAPAANLEPLLREMRGSLANLRAASEALDLLAPAQESDDARGLRRVVGLEAERLSALLGRLDAAHLLLERPPGAPLSLSAFLTALTLEAGPELEIRVEAERGTAGLRLAGGAALVAPLAATLRRLHQGFGLARLTVGARRHQDLLALDLSWPASESDVWRLGEANAELLSAPGANGPEGGSGDSLRDAVQALGGEVWITVNRTAESASLRLLLPPAAPDEKAAPRRRK